MLNQFTRSFHDCPNLHIIDFREGNAKSAPPVAKHWVKFMKKINLGAECLNRNIHCLCQINDILVLVWQELMKWWVKQTNRNRKPFHLTEQTDKVTFLHWQDLGQRPLTPLKIRRQNHLPYCGDTFCLEKHMLRTTQANPLRAKFTRYLGVMRSISVSTNLQATHRINPLHQLPKVPSQLWRHGWHLTEHNFTG